MTGVACSEYGPVEETAVNDALYSIIPGAVSFASHACADAGRRRRRPLQASSITITTDATVRDVAYGDDASKSDIVGGATSAVADAAASGALDEAIVERVATLDSTSPLRAVAMSVTLPPTPAPRVGGDADRGQATLLLVIPGLGVALFGNLSILGVAYYRRTQKKKQDAKAGEEEKKEKKKTTTTTTTTTKEKAGGIWRRESEEEAKMMDAESEEESDRKKVFDLESAQDEARRAPQRARGKAAATDAASRARAASSAAALVLTCQARAPQCLRADHGTRCERSGRPAPRPLPAPAP